MLLDPHGGLMRLFHLVLSMVGLAACGYPRLASLAQADAGPDASSSTSPDAGTDATIVPLGSQYGYVVSKATVVPAAGHLPTELGLDLGSKTSATPDGKVDNQFGQALVVLTDLNFDVQRALDDAINRGTIILLIDFQTEDFVNTGNAGIEVKFGANPVPAACSSPMDAVCGNHLTGAASFSIAADSPRDAPLGGRIVNGTFNSDAGNLTLKIALGTTAPIALNLIHARVKATTISEAGIMSANLGGLLTVDALNTKVGPAVQTLFTALLSANCTDLTSPPNCGCTGTAATLVVSQIDGDTGTARDCAITVDELLNYSVIKTVLQPDSCSKDSCTAADSLSVGVKIEGVKATFPI